MEYNIHYEIAASIFLVLLYVFHHIQYNTASIRNRYFKLLMLSILVADISDIIGCITITYPQNVSLFTNYFINIIYYISSAMTTYILSKYIESFFDEKVVKKAYKIVNRSILATYALLAFTTPWHKLLFFFNENREYKHGFIYILLYIVPITFMFYSMLLIIINKKQITNRQFASLLSYVVIMQTATILQFVLFGKTLVAYFGAAIGAMILLFALETPDYQKLVKTMKDLEDASHTKSIFLANMSHEIRTPINGILGINEIALQETDDENMKEHLTDIKAAGENLLTIINDILDFSKIESGKLDIVPVTYEVSATVRALKTMLQKRADDKKLDLIFDIDKNIPQFLVGDEIRVRQILINLLTNAIKYTEKGSVTLKVRYEKASETSIMLKMDVIDSGIGISEENIDKLFSAFERFDLQKNRTIEGTGLGLRISKNLAELMDGSITCVSEYGKGSTFTLLIPQMVPEQEELIKNKSANSDNNANEKDSLYLPKFRILVVDDVKMNFKVVVGLLKPTGIQIVTAESGKECIEQFDNKLFDMILLDQMMPEMDGIETLHVLLEREKYKKKPIPIIALTANAIDGAKEMCLSQGFTDYLSKPVKRQVLYEMIDKYSK